MATPPNALESPSLKLLAAFLAHHRTVRYIRFQWIDLFGILRVRLIDAAYAARLAAAPDGGRLALPPFAQGIMVDELRVPDAVIAGADHIFPDWSSLRPTNFGGAAGGGGSSSGEPRYASVMCALAESDCAKGDVGRSRCARTALECVVAEARDAHDIEFLVGFEVEFMMLGIRGGNHNARGNGKGGGAKASAGAGKGGGGDGNDDGEAGDGTDDSLAEYYPLSRRGGLFTASGVRTGVFAYVEECVDALAAAGVPVVQFHSEGPAGQFEVSLAPLPPLQAVDAMVAAHETIKNVLARHGRAATMYPKPFADLPANGSHMHISLHRASAAAAAPGPTVKKGGGSGGPYYAPALRTNARERESDITHTALIAVFDAAAQSASRAHITDAEDAHFLAGVLRRLPALCAWAAPVHDSYTRLRPMEAGAAVEWGTENRGAPVRKVRRAHWEFRLMDACANAYAALAACLAAGLLGLRGREELVWPDRTLQGNNAFFAPPPALPSSSPLSSSSSASAAGASAAGNDGKKEVEEGRAKGAQPPPPPPPPPQPLPTTLSEAIAQLKHNAHGLDSLLGRALVQRYIEVKEFEDRKFATPAAPATRWAGFSTAEFEARRRRLYMQKFS